VFFPAKAVLLVFLLIVSFVLLMPVEWSEEGWPKIARGHRSTDVIKKPPGEDVSHGMPLSDVFTTEHLGPQWRHWERDHPSGTYISGNG